MRLYRSLKGVSPSLKSMGAAASQIKRGAGVYLDTAGKVSPAAGDKKPDGIALADVESGGEVLAQVVTEDCEYFIGLADGTAASDIAAGNAYTLSADGVSLEKTSGSAVIADRAYEDGFIVRFTKPSSAS